MRAQFVVRMFRFRYFDYANQRYFGNQIEVNTFWMYRSKIINQVSMFNIKEFKLLHNKRRAKYF